jgi:ribosomal-protein-serine acetyltransferase
VPPCRHFDVERLISGPGVTLRIWAGRDRQALAAILEASGAELRAWLPALVDELADLDAFLTRAESTFRAGSDFSYAIEVDGEVVGQCSLHPGGEVGYWIRTDRAGRGLATAAVTTLVSAALEDGVGELVIHCDEGNRASAEVSRKSGFTHTATVRIAEAAGQRTGREMTFVLRR